MGQATACLGVLTLGQSPRQDVIPTLRAILGAAIVIREAGGLDGLSPAAIKALSPRDGEVSIETRLRSGEGILLSKERLFPHLVTAGLALQAQCRQVLLLCSGEFAGLAAACPGLILPVNLLRGVIGAVAGEQILGVIGPATDMDRAPDQWGPFARSVLCAAGSPYGPLSEVVTAGRQLATAGAGIIFLDDMAFTEEHRRAVTADAKRPVICATTITARVLAEIISP